MSIAFVVLKLDGGKIDPPKGVTGSRYKQGGIGLRIDPRNISRYSFKCAKVSIVPVRKHLNWIQVTQLSRGGLSYAEVTLFQYKIQ